MAGCSSLAHCIKSWKQFSFYLPIFCWTEAWTANLQCTVWHSVSTHNIDSRLPDPAVTCSYGLWTAKLFIIYHIYLLSLNRSAYRLIHTVYCFWFQLGKNVWSVYYYCYYRIIVLSSCFLMHCYLTMQGYRNEPSGIMGHVTRLDADCYLWKVFMLAKRAFSPDAVIHLGKIIYL